MIKVVLFDLGKVVVDFDWKNALDKISLFCNVDKSSVVNFFTDQSNDCLFVEGKITGQNFYKRAKQALGFDLYLEDFRTIYNSIFSPIPKMEKIILKLKNNYTLAILSNTNAFHFPYVLDNFPILKNFDEYVVSYEEKCQKPNPLIYEKALARLNVLANEVVFIDDLKENVIAANELGIKGVWHRDGNDLSDELRAIGVCFDF